MAALSVLLGQRPVVCGGGLQPDVARAAEDLRIQSKPLHERTLQFCHRHFLPYVQVALRMDSAHLVYHQLVVQPLPRW